jgi:hypothetical protein
MLIALRVLAYIKFTASCVYEYSPNVLPLLLYPLPSLSPEAPAGKAHDTGEGDGRDLHQELLAWQLGGELPGGELGFTAGCCPVASLHLFSFNSASPVLDYGDWARGFPPSPWQGLGPRAAAFGESGVELAAGGVRWVLQDVPSAVRTVSGGGCGACGGLWTPGQI